MCTKPPGDANALTPSVSSTMNVHGSFGRSDCCASVVPTSVTYLWIAGSCTTPNRWRILRADVLADLPFFLVGERQVVELLLRFLRLLGLLQRAAEPAELRVGRAARASSTTRTIDCFICEPLSHGRVVMSPSLRS